MKHPRRSRLAMVLLCAVLLSLGACKSDPIQSSLEEATESPSDHIWFEELLGMLGRMHAALDEAPARVELRLRLLAGREDLAMKQLGIAQEEWSDLLRRLEEHRADLEARWPQLREHTAFGGDSNYPTDLIDRLASEEWPVLPGELAKPPQEYVCAALELYDNLSRCVSWNTIAQAFCMYQAYLRYLEHMSLGCDG